MFLQTRGMTGTNSESRWRQMRPTRGRLRETTMQVSKDMAGRIWIVMGPGTTLRGRAGYGSRMEPIRRAGIRMGMAAGFTIRARDMCGPRRTRGDGRRIGVGRGDTGRGLAGDGLRLSVVAVTDGDLGAVAVTT